MNQWFRMYAELLDDPKVQRLPAETFKAWVNILCLACRHDGTIPGVADVAFALRVSESRAEVLLQSLRSVGLIDEDQPHNWNGRQYKSDVSNERVKRHRERHRNGDCNVTQTVTVTPPDTEQIQNRTDSPPAPTERPPTKRGSRIPDDWRPDDDDRAFAASLGLDSGQVDATAAEFRDYWRAKAGGDGVKLDWSATWRNWCRRDKRFNGNRAKAAYDPAEAERSRRKAILAGLSGELGAMGINAAEGG